MGLTTVALSVAPRSPLCEYKGERGGKRLFDIKQHFSVWSLSLLPSSSGVVYQWVFPSFSRSMTTRRFSIVAPPSLPYMIRARRRRRESLRGKQQRHSMDSLATFATLLIRQSILAVIFISHGLRSWFTSILISRDMCIRNDFVALTDSEVITMNVNCQVES